MKYKLIKIYPGSPKLGTIVKVQKDGYIHWNVNSNIHNLNYIHPTNYIHNSSIEQYKEFWQPIVEKDYEILRFILPGNLEYYSKCLNNVIHVQNAKNSIEFMLKNPNTYKIYSVKRKSDGEIFTIGDNTKYGCIDKFYIKNDYLLAIIILESNGRYLLEIGLKDLEKIKQPLFTTEDGVDIFEGDSFAHTSGWTEPKIIRATSKHLNYKLPMDKLFSTKEKAEEFILLNKPCLSYGDIQEFIKVKDCNKVLELIKQKLNNNK
jgi:hypothetical protein